MLKAVIRQQAVRLVGSMMPGVLSTTSQRYHFYQNAAQTTAKQVCITATRARCSKWQHKCSQCRHFIMAVLRSRCGHYIFALRFLSSIFLYSLPNLSSRRLDVYYTTTHGVALVRI